MPDNYSPKTETMKRLLLLLIPALMLTGCNPTKYCPKHGYFQQIGNDTTYRERIVERERIIEVPVASDSGYLRAWIECVKNKTVITQVTEYKPRERVKP